MRELQQPATRPTPRENACTDAPRFAILLTEESSPNSTMPPLVRAVIGRPLPASWADDSALVDPRGPPRRPPKLSHYMEQGVRDAHDCRRQPKGRVRQNDHRHQSRGVSRAGRTTNVTRRHGPAGTLHTWPADRECADIQNHVPRVRAA